MTENPYPYLEIFSNEVGISKDNLVKAFEIEKKFHDAILSEVSFDKRKQLYKEVYNIVHEIYGSASSNIAQRSIQKNKIAEIFKKELEGKKILDVGCGAGLFLESIERNMKYEKLVGLDVYFPDSMLENSKIEYIKSDIIDFSLEEKFDVVFSDQVMEHIAPSDLGLHLSSIRRVLKDRGLLIVIMPNRLFGPTDVTRIIDFTYSGITKAQGTHLNESTYSEMISMLNKNGFSNFRTILPIPKIRRIFNNMRIHPSVITTIEKSSLLLNILRRITYKNRCVIRLGIILICEVSSDTTK